MRLQGYATVAVVGDEGDMFRLGVQPFYHADIGGHIVLIDKAALNRGAGEVGEEVQRLRHPCLQVRALFRQKHYIAAGKRRHYRNVAPDGVFQRQIGSPRFLSYQYDERGFFGIPVLGQDARHSRLPQGRLGETLAVHVLQLHTACTAQTLKLFHEVGNVVRSLARVRIIRTDNQYRMVARRRKGREHEGEECRQAKQCSIKYFLGLSHLTSS